MRRVSPYGLLSGRKCRSVLPSWPHFSAPDYPGTSVVPFACCCGFRQMVSRFQSAGQRSINVIFGLLCCAGITCGIRRALSGPRLHLLLCLSHLPQWPFCLSCDGRIRRVFSAKRCASSLAVAAAATSVPVRCAFPVVPRPSAAPAPPSPKRLTTSGFRSPSSGAIRKSFSVPGFESIYSNVANVVLVAPVLFQIHTIFSSPRMETVFTIVSAITSATVFITTSC